ncbi:MAG: NADH-quinone oxidoreductase subunit C [Syntrophobacteraceae bacterium]
MDKIEDILISMGARKPREKKPEERWVADPGIDVEKMAMVMVEAGARLVTVSASSLDTGEFRLIYHWDLEGNLLNCVTVTRQGALPGIAQICPAADWIEREIHDYFTMNFTGRDLPPLVLNEQDPPGTFSRKFQHKGKAGGRA